MGKGNKTRKRENSQRKEMKVERADAEGDGGEYDQNTL